MRHLFNTSQRLGTILLATAVLCTAQVPPKGHRWYGQNVGATLAREIAVGGGEVWVIGSEEAGAGNYSVGHLVWSQFERITGQAVRIAVDGTGTPWVITAQGTIWKRNPNNAGGWEQVPGGATEIAAGGDEVWVIGGTSRKTNNSIYRWNATSKSWIQVPGQGSKISVSASGHAYVVNTGGTLWKLDKGAPSWVEIARGISYVNASKNVQTGKDKDVVVAVTTAGLTVTLTDGTWYASNGDGSPNGAGPVALRVARDDGASLSTYAIALNEQYGRAGYVVAGEPNESEPEAAARLASAGTPGPQLGYAASITALAGATYSTASAPATWMKLCGANWMSYLPDTIPLHKLSLAGTHDSAARYGGDSGVRYLDIRTRDRQRPHHPLWVLPGHYFRWSHDAGS